MFKPCEKRQSVCFSLNRATHYSIWRVDSLFCCLAVTPKVDDKIDRLWSKLSNPVDHFTTFITVLISILIPDVAFINDL